MVKKIKFPLEMKNGVKAKNIYELRKNFDLKKIVNYYLDGRLLRWLNNAEYKIEAQKISDIDVNSIDLTQKLCEIFEVEFTLEMKDGVKVRNLDELKKNFSSKKMMEYFINGKLLTWLMVWDYKTQLEDVEKLKQIPNVSVNSVFVCKEICEVLDLESEYKMERMNKLDIVYREDLREPDDYEIRKKSGINIRINGFVRSMFNVYNVAFNQDELNDLVKRNVRNIYLYGENFNIDTEEKNITYVGIGLPKVHLNNVTQDKLDNSGIILENVLYDGNITLNFLFWEYDYSIRLNDFGRETIVIKCNKIYILKGDNWFEIYKLNSSEKYTKIIFTREKIFFTTNLPSYIDFTLNLYQYDFNTERVEVIDEYIRDFILNNKKLIYIKELNNLHNSEEHNIENHIIQINLESDYKKILEENARGQMNSIRLFENTLYYLQTIRTSLHSAELKGSQIILYQNEE